MSEEERFQRFSTRTAYSLEEVPPHKPDCWCEACDAMAAVRIVDRLRGEVERLQKLKSAWPDIVALIELHDEEHPEGDDMCEVCAVIDAIEPEKLSEALK